MSEKTARQTDEKGTLMQKPRNFVTRMGLFLLAGMAVAAVLREQVHAAFLANPGLNGVILTALLIGVVFALRRVTDLNREIDWITAFKKQEIQSTDKPPRLLAPAASLLGKNEEARIRLSALSMRSVLDGLASRLEESREISRYLTGLLVFLGLLGTFWGLLATIGSMGNTISGLNVDGADIALMFDELKAGLSAPLEGMAIAFSSSLFGLAGSLVLGFMDLQASQAQNRFYNDVEDWLASVTHLSRGGGEEGVVSAAQPSGYLTALLEQTADGIDKLSRTMTRTDEGRQSLQEGMIEIARAIASLSDRLDASGKSETERSRLLAGALEKLAVAGSVKSEPALDAATKDHIRNMDVSMKRMVEEQARSTELLVDELRGELKLLSRTLARTVESGMIASANGAVSAKPASSGDGGEREQPAMRKSEKTDLEDEGPVEVHSTDTHPFLKVGGVPLDETDRPNNRPRDRKDKK